jgi:hypothetical protein
MNDYLVFIWECFEASGGWNDFVGCFDDLESALDKMGSYEAENRIAHIVHNGKIIIRADGMINDRCEECWIVILMDSSIKIKEERNGFAKPKTSDAK